MLKVVSSDAWKDSLWGEDNPRCALIERSSRGVINKQAFVKRACASSDELLSKIDNMDVKKGEVLLHLIGLGATESYGPNRNGDGFSKEACRKYHPCFVKEARVYRDHKNTDKSKSYGIVKASAFNEAMDRVELIVALNSTPEAARANKGLLADKEMQKLASGKDIPFSMACSVPYDICSYCGNKAHTQSEYCKGTHEGGRCKAGGLRHNMGKIASVDGELVQLYADNTKPAFFDISHVFVPADRIAYSSGRLTKQAAYGAEANYSGAELAERLCITGGSRYEVDAPVKRAVHLLKTAVADFHGRFLWEKRASFLSVLTAKPLEDIAVARRYKFAAVQRALQDLYVCLTPSQFVQLVGDMPMQKAAELGEIIAPLSNDLIEKAASVSNVPMPAVSAPDLLKQWAYRQSLPTLHPERFFKQAAKAAIADAPEFQFTTASVYNLSQDPAIAELAKEYALYKVAFVANLPEALQETAAELLTGRDYVGF